jgi:hypothetical protein
MLALTLAEAVHQESAKQVFHRNHPGGAIGAKARKTSHTSVQNNEEARKTSRTPVQKVEGTRLDERHTSYPFPSPS